MLHEGCTNMPSAVVLLQISRYAMPNVEPEN